MKPGDRIGRGILFAIVTFACFSSADAVVKVMSAEYSVLLIYFVTTAFAALPIAALVWFSRRPIVLRPRFPKAVAARTLLMACDTFGAYLAFSRLPLANAYTLIFASPLIVTALSPWLLGESIGRHRWSAVVVGFIGILVVLRPGSASLDIGYLGALGSACAFGIALIITRQIGGRESDTAMLTWLIVGKLIVSGAFLPISYTPMAPADFLLMALAGLFVGVAQICIVQAFKLAPPATVAPFQYTQMLWAALYGFLLFGDVPGAYVIAGSGLVVLSGLYILWREHVVHRRGRRS
jgi:drug/metabolite transporter (DMT)-like permease